MDGDAACRVDGHQRFRRMSVEGERMLDVTCHGVGREGGPGSCKATGESDP